VSRPDLLDQLRSARPLVPGELRELVRQIADEAEPKKPRRQWRLDWRPVLAAGVLVAAAIAAALVLRPGSTHGGDAGARGALLTLSPPAHTPSKSPPVSAAAGSAFPAAQKTAQAAAAAVPSPSPNRVQRITTSLELRVASTGEVSSGAQQAVQITHALGGYPSSLDVNAAGRTGYADLVLRIPKQRLQAAVSRLSALGTVVGENVTIHDLQNQVDATARKIARLEARLKAWQEQFQTAATQKQIAELTDEIGKLSRGRVATIHSASYATLSLQLTTRPAPAPAKKPGHGPLHNLGVAFRWLGIGALYAVALAAPFVLLGVLVWLVARAVRRHRENQLLGSS
jgi:Domain of unknown function (DUF4349)